MAGRVDDSDDGVDPEQIIDSEGESADQLKSVLDSRWEELTDRGVADEGNQDP